MKSPYVRLDSLDPVRGDRSFLFQGLQREIIATRLDEVLPALKRVEGEVAGGAHAAGFVTYEAAPAFEPALAAHPPAPGLPLVWFGVFRDRLSQPPLAGLAAGEEYRLRGIHPSLSPDLYRRSVRRVLDLIAAGETYQVNYTFPLLGSFTGSDAALYRDVCRSQRSAYCAFIRLDRYSVISASPELFFRRRADRIEMRPMKGTRPRGRWTEDDEAIADELRASPKERAENLMIVDLLRNDLGRVARFGSVEVPSLFRIERYPTVHQLTSSVTARLRGGVGLGAIFQALFPSGSVTGAPKIRTSQIIRDLESSPRGIYTGAIGFVSAGEAAFSVAIRTALVDRESGRVEVGVGSGITADSEPAAEYAESLAKSVFLTRRTPDFRLLESLRLEVPGGYRLLESHLARLSRSASYFGFTVDPEVVREALCVAAEKLPQGVYKVRLLHDREGGIEIGSESIPEKAARVRVGLAVTPVDEAEPFLYHKTTARSIYDERAAERPDCDEVAIVNRRGELTETTTSNLVLDIDGELLTPPVECGLLPGVFRERLLEEGSIRTRALTPADLERARAVHLINSVRGWREAVLVPHRHPVREG